MEDIRTKIKKAVKERGLIQAAIARRAGISPAKLSQIVNLRSGLSLDDYLRICGAIGVKPSEMLDDIA
ncbi:MAG: helix-turn-helix domain-containing protein [Christensenellaceae bacterium]|nr:helix-turn-helix domain-containing protein [Christensenellaceae bacterium]